MLAYFGLGAKVIWIEAICPKRRIDSDSALPVVVLPPWSTLFVQFSAAGKANLLISYLRFRPFPGQST
jgi:hypothetical protein